MPRPSSRTKDEHHDDDEDDEDVDDEDDDNDNDDEEEEEEEEGYDGAIIEVVEGLHSFITSTIQNLQNWRIEAGPTKFIVVLNTTGYRMIPIPQNHVRRIIKNVNTSNVVFSRQPIWDNLHGPMADCLWYIRKESVHFFETMWLMDPLGNGDCGFLVLEFFTMFLDGRVWAPMEMRHFLKKELDRNLDYYKTSRILAAMSCPPGTDSDFWTKEGEAISLATLPEDFDERNQENLFDIAKTPNPGEKPVTMDCKHLEVFARATKTRIVLLFCWGRPGKHMKTEDTQFTCLDIDWRNVADDGSAPPVKFTNGIPDFGDTFDYYRTAVIMNVHTCQKVAGDNITWSTTESERHFTLWLPSHYNPRITTIEQLLPASEEREEENHEREAFEEEQEEFKVVYDEEEVFHPTDSKALGQEEHVGDDQDEHADVVAEVEAKEEEKEDGKVFSGQQKALQPTDAMALTEDNSQASLGKEEVECDDEDGDEDNDIDEAMNEDEDKNADKDKDKKEKDEVEKNQKEEDAYYISDGTDDGGSDIITVVEGLHTFITSTIQNLQTFAKKAKKISRSIVLLNVTGHKTIPIPFQFPVTRITRNVNTSDVVYCRCSTWENLHTTLADCLWYIRKESTQFFETMWLMDPLGYGDCGFLVLEFFTMFLNGRVWTPLEMRRFIVQELWRNLEYYKTSRILAAMSRPPGTDSDFWTNEGEAMSLATLPNDFDEGNKGNLFDIVKMPQDDDEPFEMDCKHLEVFARATKTRIVLLFCWALPGQHMKTEDTQFTCLDIDWRNVADDGPAPPVKFSNGIPNFGDTFDYYRTAIIMNVHTCKEVYGDEMTWSSNKSTRHFTLWLPSHYDPGTLPVQEMLPALEETKEIELLHQNRVVVAASLTNHAAALVETKEIELVHQQRMDVADSATNDDPALLPALEETKEIDSVHRNRLDISDATTNDDAALLPSLEETKEIELVVQDLLPALEETKEIELVDQHRMDVADSTTNDDALQLPSLEETKVIELVHQHRLDVADSATNDDAARASHCLIDVGEPTTQEEISAWNESHGVKATSSRLFFLEQEQNHNAWFTVIRPTLRVYPKIGPDHISYTARTRGLERWLVTSVLSAKVRRFFPGILNETLHPFVCCTVCPDIDVPMPGGMCEIQSLYIFPFQLSSGLYTAPPPQVTDMGHLARLALSELPLGKNQQVPSILFRNIMKMPQIRNRVFCVYTTLPLPGVNVAEKSPFGKNVLKIKEFFIKDGNVEAMYRWDVDEKKQFRNRCLVGDTLSFTVLSESGKQDTLIAAVQFKRTAYGAWINYLCTTGKVADQNSFGNKGGFLPRDTSFRGMGLAFTLLRAVQLIQCCNGHAPTLFIQLKRESKIYAYLHMLGFKIIERPGDSTTLTGSVESTDFRLLHNDCKPQESVAFNWREDQSFIMLECSRVVSWSEDLEWKPVIFDSYRYHHSKHQTGISTWPADYQMFSYPIATDGKFIDQCAKGLSMLGSPFFYFRDQSRLVGTTFTNRNLQRTIMTGAKLLSMEALHIGDSKQYLTEEHVQFLVNWVFRDDENPAIKQFHCVPVSVTGQVTHFFEGSCNADTAMNVIDKYCRENWKRLSSFMVFFVRNIGNYHWILDVAVNPYRMISLVAGSCLAGGLDTQLYGFFRIDPLEGNDTRNGTIPISSGFPSDSPLHCREMVFLLNCMSRYRDLNVHGFLDEFKPKLDDEYLFALGSAGPFGRVFVEKDAESANAFWDACPNSYFPQLKTVKKTFPVQSDSYNCGIYLIYTMQDLVLTQWNANWSYQDIVKESETDPVDVWHAQICGRTPIVLPATLGIGTAFVFIPEKTVPSLYKRLCDYMRMEMVLLMERMHCLYIEAFSRRDCRTKWWLLGKPRMEYRNAIVSDKDLKYIHDGLFRNCPFPTIEELKKIDAKQSLTDAFIQCKERAIFTRGCYFDLLMGDALLELFPSNDYLEETAPKNLDAKSRKLLREISNTQLSELCNSYRGKVESFRKRKLPPNSTDHQGRPFTHTGNAMSPQTVGTIFSPKKGDDNTRNPPVPATSVDVIKSTKRGSASSSSSCSSTTTTDRSMSEIPSSQRHAKSKAVHGMRQSSRRTAIALRDVGTALGKKDKISKSKQAINAPLSEPPKVVAGNETTEASEKKTRDRSPTKDTSLPGGAVAVTGVGTAPRRSSPRRAGSTMVSVVIGSSPGKANGRGVLERELMSPTTEKSTNIAVVTQPSHAKSKKPAVGVATKDKSTGKTSKVVEGAVGKSNIGKRTVTDSVAKKKMDYKKRRVFIEDDEESSEALSTQSDVDDDIGETEDESDKLPGGGKGEHSDDDSFVLVTPKVSGTALYDFQANESVIETKRIRKQTTRFTITYPVRPTATITKKVHAIDPDDIWWVGESAPIMPKEGETDPLYAKVHKPTRAHSIPAFAEGKLARPDLRQAGEYQMSRKACLKYVNRCLGRPNTQEELDSKCDSFENEDTAIAIRDWFKSTSAYVQTEVNLALLKNKIRLKYIAIPSLREGREGINRERGRYEALVTIEDTESQDYGKSILYHPTNDWIEENFSKECLTIVQKVAKETRTVYQIEGSSKTEKGFIPLDKNLTYIDGGAERQISKMRYLPAKKVKNMVGEEVDKLESWRGLIVVSRSDVAQQVTLDSNWVNENISKQMQKFVKDVRIKGGHSGFVYIPEGDSNGHGINGVHFEDNAPKVICKKENGTDGHRRCVLDSAASGLQHLGWNRLSSLLRTTTDDPTETANPMTYLANVLQTKMNKEERRKFVYIALNKKKLRTWNILVSPSDYLLCVLGIRSNDGKTDHAICIADGWIFDSTFERALPLNAESLDICSSSTDRKTNFVEVTRGHLLRERIDNI